MKIDTLLTEMPCISKHSKELFGENVKMGPPRIAVKCIWEL